jgi:hypothetical protein
VALTFIWAIPSSLAQNKEAMEKIERHKSMAELMSAIHNWGIDRNVERQIRQFGPRLAADLEYAGSGGVLIVARLEKTETDSGTYNRLIGDRVDYVGIGATDYDAEIANIAKVKLEAGVTPGSMFDAENSTAYWFYKSGSDVAMREKPLSWLRREVINELATRKQRSYDWRTERSAELTRLANATTARIDEAEESSTMALLLQSRKEALAKQAAINTALREDLERAQKASEKQEALKAIGFLTNYASFVSQFNASPQQSNASPMTREQALARLSEIISDANAKAEQLAQDLKEQNNSVLQFDMRLETNLRELKVPTDNLPPVQAPINNPPPN